jgi:K+-sensing histidine kinase KdpD
VKKNDNVISEDTIGLLVHSYNNYLSGLMGFTELALMECEQPVVKERLDMSLDSGKEAVVFGKQLLSSISRLQVGLKPVCFAQIVEQLAKEDIVLADHISSMDEIFIKTDLNWFLYCLKSIIIFSRDYAKQLKLDSNKVELSANQDSDTVEITISSKLNFSEEEVRQLFNPFYTSRTLLGQKDVGLSMVKGFVTQMKGNIKWQANKGFVMTLPLIINAQDAGE